MTASSISQNTTPGIGHISTGGQTITSNGQPSGGNAGPPAAPVTTQIEPPDDRYFPGSSTVDADGNTTNIGPRLKELNVPVSIYGLPIPITFGSRRLFGNIIWAQPLREVKTGSKTGGGGGGGDGKGGGGGGSSGPTTTTTTYSYYGTFAVSFGKPSGIPAVARDLLRVWADGTLVLDKRGTGPNAINMFKANFHKGVSTQLPDSIIEHYEGVGEVSAYRDLMYIVVNELPLAGWGNRIPSVSIEVGDATTKNTIDTQITATNDSLHLDRSAQSPMVDWMRQRAYVMGDGVGTADFVNIFSMTNDSYLFQVPVNPLGAGNSGLLFGSFGYATYVPWLGKIISTQRESGGEPNIEVLYSFIPEVGIADAWCEGPSTSSAGHLFIPIPVYGSTGLQTFIFQGNSVDTWRMLRMGGPITADQGADAGENLITLVKSNTNAPESIVGGNHFHCGVFAGFGIETGVWFVGHGPYIYRGTVAFDAYQDPQTLASVGVTFAEWKDLGDENDEVVWAMVYWAVDDSLIVLVTGATPVTDRVIKYDATSGDEIWSTDLPSSPAIFNANNAHLSDISNGLWAFNGTGNTIIEVDLISGEATAHSTAGLEPRAMGSFDSTTRSIFGSPGGTNPNRMRRMYYDRLGDERMPLADFILGMALEAGFDPDTEIDISPNIDDTIDGAIISEVTDFRSILTNLAPIYQLDWFESNGVIKITRKAVDFSSTDFEFEESDLALPEGSVGERESIRVRREQQTSSPDRVTIKYLDKSLGYLWAAQMATRSRFIETNDSNNQIAYQVPIIMTAVEAKTLAQRALWAAWNSRMSYKFLLTQQALDLEPGDVGSVEANGITYTVRIVDISYNADFTVELACQGFLSDYPLSVEADAGAGYEQTIPTTAWTQVFVLDVPLLYGSHDLSGISQFPHYYIPAPLNTDPWPGGGAFIARDRVSYVELGQNVLDIPMGYATAALGVPADAYATDYDNTLNIRVASGDATLLESCTYAEMMDGANIGIVGAHGRWEVIQFQTVTPEADGTYTLSVLTRGKRGTDWHCGDHITGDQFIYLRSDWVKGIPMALSEIGSTYDWKGVGFNQQLFNQIAISQTVEGNASLPWPPVNVRMVRQADGDIDVTWNRRSRTIGALVDETDEVPITDFEENDFQLTFYRNRWTETGPIEHDDGEDVGLVDTVTNAEAYELTVADIEANELNAYVDPVSMILTPSNIYPENPYSLSDELNFRYIWVKIQQKSNVPGVTYGPGRKELVYVE